MGIERLLKTPIGRKVGAAICTGALALSLGNVVLAEEPEEPKEGGNIEVSYETNSGGPESMSDIPLVTDGHIVSVSAPLAGKTIDVACQQNDGFDDGTDHCYLGTSIELSENWTIHPGIRYLNRSSAQEAQGLGGKINLGVGLEGDIGPIPIRIQTVMDTSEGGQNFGLVRGYIQGAPVGDAKIYAALGEKMPDAGNSLAGHADWLVGGGSDAGGLFMSDSTQGTRGYNGFFRSTGFSIVGYGKTGPDSSWGNVKWTAARSDNSLFSADTQYFISQVLGDMIIRPLFPSDPVDYFRLSDAPSGLLAAYNDGTREYVLAEAGMRVGSTRILGNRVDWYAGAGIKAGNGVPDVPALRVAANITTKMGEMYVAGACEGSDCGVFIGLHRSVPLKGGN